MRMLDVCSTLPLSLQPIGRQNCCLRRGMPRRNFAEERAKDDTGGNALAPEWLVLVAKWSAFEAANKPAIVAAHTEKRSAPLKEKPDSPVIYHWRNPRGRVLLGSIMHKWSPAGDHAGWYTAVEFQGRVLEMLNYEVADSTAGRWLAAEKSAWRQCGKWRGSRTQLWSR